MGIWLYDVINLSGKSVGLQQGSRYRNLTHITTTVDTVTGYQSNAFVFYHNRGHTRVHVYDDSAWKLKIVIRQDGKPDLIDTWDIQKNYSRYSFVFDVERIWFYSTDNSLKLRGRAHPGWVVQLNENNWGWSTYDIAAVKADGVRDEDVVIVDATNNTAKLPSHTG